MTASRKAGLVCPLWLLVAKTARSKGRVPTIWRTFDPRALLAANLARGKTTISRKRVLTRRWRPWPLDSPSYDNRSNSSEDATCIDLTGSDNEDELPLNPPSGGYEVGSPETAIHIDLTGIDDRYEFSGSGEDDELPPLSILLKRAKRPTCSQVR